MPTITHQPPQLLTTSEAADYIRAARQTRANWRSVGHGPNYVKPFGRVLYRRADLDAWISQEGQR